MGTRELPYSYNELSERDSLIDLESDSVNVEPLSFRFVTIINGRRFSKYGVRYKT